MKKVGFLVLGCFSLLLLVAAACGGGEAAPTATATPTPTPLSPPPTPTATTTSPPAAAPTPTAAAPVETPPPAGDLAAKGREIYLKVPDNAAPQALWCSTCHQIEGVSAGLIGPDHTQIGRDAATRIPGLSAEEYLKQSITDPTAHIAEGVERATAGLMTNAITENLTGEQVDALVAFLLTLQ